MSDPTGVLATPLEAVEAPGSRRGLVRLLSLVEELGVERVVVGLPLSLSGGESDQTRTARAFASLLQSRLPVPVELHDERLTTRLAARTGGQASEDSRAAAHLLESWLAAQPREQTSGGAAGG